MPKRSLSLTVKFIIFITLLLILVISGLSFFFISQERKTLDNGLKDLGISLANNLAYNSEYGVLTANAAALSDLAKGIMEQQDVVYCIILDSKGKLLTPENDKNKMVIPAKIIDRANRSKGLLVQLFRDTAGVSYYDISVPVKSVIKKGSYDETSFIIEQVKKDEEVVGVVRVGISLARAELVSRESVRISLMITLIIIFVSILIMIILMQVGLAPVKKLLEATKKIAKGDFDFVVQVKNEDEIGVLASAFNKMTESLKKITVSRDQLSLEIVERKKVEEELKQAYAKLKEAQERFIQSEKMDAIGRLASGVAHEVKNPLGVILQGLNYLQKRFAAEDKEVLGVIEMMTANVKRADEIVRALVDFSRLDKFTMKPEDINAILESSIVLIKHSVKVENIEIIRDLQDNLPKVRADRGKMEQVYINLFINAMQAMPKGGKLFIRSYLTKIGEDAIKGEKGYFKSGEEAVVVEIEDTGGGIPKNILLKVFEPFFTTKRPNSGTGLGLTVTASIIELHEGYIKLQSEEGKGAKFTIFLKLAGT